MRNLLLALLIVVACVVGSYWLLLAAGVQKELAQPIASVFLGVLPILHKALERVSKRRIGLFDKRRVVTYAEFRLPHAVVFVYTLVVTILAHQGSGLVALFVMLWGMDEYRVNTPDLPVVPMLVPMLIVQFALGYLIARWAGLRSGAFGFLHVFIAFGLSVSVEHAFRLMMLLGGNWQIMFGAKPTLAMLFATWWSALVMWWIIGAIGFVRGRYLRPTRYATYLLRKLPLSTRADVVDLLYGEVRRVRATREAENIRQGHVAASPVEITSERPGG